MTRPSVREAQQIAAMLRRTGYPNACPAPEYCIDAEIGSDKFYTYTVSVYAGDYQEDSIPDVIQRAFTMTKIRSLLGSG